MRLLQFKGQYFIAMCLQHHYFSVSQHTHCVNTVMLRNLAELILIKNFATTTAVYENILANS